MQSKTKKAGEARVFPQIWADCSEVERKVLRREIVLNCKCCPATLWSWTTGRQRPRQLEVMNEMVDIIRDVLGIETTVVELFNYSLPWTPNSQNA